MSENNSDINKDLLQKRNEPLRILVFSVSLRKDSLNTKLAELAAQKIEANGGKVDIASMKDFDCPSYNQELEVENDFPKGAQEFQKRILANDAFIIASPEYNGSMPGLIKNSIDWVSRFRPQPFNEKQCMLMSASPSMGGGNKALWSLRIPLEHLGARVYPSMFSLAMAHKAIEENGTLNDKALELRFEDNIKAFMSLVEAAKHYPCIKKAWVEFLGEITDPVTERME